MFSNEVCLIIEYVDTPEYNLVKYIHHLKKAQMENFYTSYTKTVQGKTYYFVKKFLTFPEFNNVPNVLVGYGMHTDFDKACSIAMIHESTIRLQLLNNMVNGNNIAPEQAKVIDMLPAKYESKSVVR